MSQTAAASKFKQLSPAEFFYNNRSMAGFDNASRAAYTVVRELIENSLDACDVYGIPPVLYISIKTLLGDDMEILVADNGIGVPRRHMADAFGRVFFGSKYYVKQNRGTFGLGGKMAILYGQLTTGEPVDVRTSVGKDIAHMLLNIDVSENEPVIVRREDERNPGSFHGTSIRLRFKGDMVSARSRILKYLRMSRIALPYSTIVYSDPEGFFFFAPALTEQQPKPPKEAPPHPYGVDIVKIKEMIESSKRGTPLNKFLMKFSRVGVDTSQKFAEYLGLDPSLQVKRLGEPEIKRIAEGFRSYRFLPPDGSSLSPLGPETIRTGLQAEYSPEYIVVETRPPSAYEGFAFVIEAAIAYGGSIPPATGQDEARLLRFANKIPLIYDSSNDVAMKVILEDVDWRNYSLDPKNDPLIFLTHVVASKVPFKTAGKEYVADREEVRREIRLAFRECARQLKVYLSRKTYQLHEHQRKERMLEYINLLSKYSAALSGRPVLKSDTLLKLVGRDGGEPGSPENGQGGVRVAKGQEKEVAL